MHLFYNMKQKLWKNGPHVYRKFLKFYSPDISRDLLFLWWRFKIFELESDETKIWIKFLTILAKALAKK